jgi:hypothetical protein
MSIDLAVTETEPLIKNTRSKTKTKTNPPIKKSDDYILPNKTNFSKILSTNNYTIKQLKEIAAHYKIKLSSANLKSDILDRLYTYFKHFDTATLLQKNWRRVLLKQYNEMRGPARFNRRLCVNETDFFTMEDISDIPYIQFYSFKDKDNIIYGFDIMSLYNLFDKTYDKTHDKVTNPYNRNVFSPDIKKNMLQIIKFSHFFNDPIQVSMNEVSLSVTNTVSIESRIIALFHDIDILGNYTDYKWFHLLNMPQLMRYMVELKDIWLYRANLSEEVRREICPNYRDLFREMQDIDIFSINHNRAMDIALTIMEKLVCSGIHNDSRNLGANYVLCALTLVSADAALSLPWLFQSVL